MNLKLLRTLLRAVLSFPRPTRSWTLPRTLRCTPQPILASPPARAPAPQSGVARAWHCALACAFLASGLQPAPALARDPVHITLLGINDFHGNIEPPAGSVLVPDADKPAGTRVAAGGAAYLSTLVHQLKAENPGHTLVVGAGDLVGASPLASGLFHDEPTIDILNRIGLDLSSVGNHEFDKGRAELLRLQAGGCYQAPATGVGSGVGGVVGVDTCMDHGQFAGARFQYLAANVLDQATGQTLLPATALRDVDGVRIGFIGLTLQDTPTVVSPDGVAGLRFAPEIATVNRWVPVLKEQGADVVVVLIHQGGQTTARTVQDLRCPGFSGAIVALADRFDPRVDVVVSGHTHQEYVCTRPDGKLVTQTGFYGRLVSRIELWVDPDQKRVLSKSARNVLVYNGLPLKNAQGEDLEPPRGLQALAPDPEIGAIVQRYGGLVASIADTVVGRLAQPLYRRANAAGESTLGAVIADAYLAGTSDPAGGARPAQIAFTNPGGLRSDLSASLTVSFGQLYNVLPFNNDMVTMDLTGAQLLRLLEQQWERPQPPGGRILPVSYSLHYSWDARQPEGAAPGAGHRVLPDSLRLNGRRIAMDEVLRVTVNSFMAGGGDNFSVLQEGRNVQVGDNDLAVAKLYFRVRGVLAAPTEARITRLHAADPE